MSSGEEVEVNPVIKGDKVVKLVVAGVEWPLKAEVPVQELLKLMDAIRLLARYVDLARVSPPGALPGQPGLASLEPWTEEELKTFLEERTEEQKAFLRLLAERGVVSREEVVEAIREVLGRPDYSGRDLAGVVAGINRRARTLGKALLFTIERRRVGGRLVGIYRVDPRCRELLTKLLC